MRRFSIGASIVLALLPACGRSPSPKAPRGPSSAFLLPEDPAKRTIQLRSSAFADGGAIPKIHTCDGKDSSPPLRWSGVPEGSRWLILIVEDPDAPQGTWTHWVVFDIPANVNELGEGIPPLERIELGASGPTARQGRNDFGKFGYGGPCPPEGTHFYVFRIFAVDTMPHLDSGATPEQLLRAIQGRVLAEGRLTGVYSRGSPR